MEFFIALMITFLYRVTFESVFELIQENDSKYVKVIEQVFCTFFCISEIIF